MMAKCAKEKCAALRSVLVERERDGEDGPSRIGTDEPDSPAVRFGDPPRDREPEPRASRLARAGGVEAHEALEDGLAERLGDPGPGLRDRDGGNRVRPGSSNRLRWSKAGDCW
jgi:hypothetical protein